MSDEQGYNAGSRKDVAKRRQQARRDDKAIGNAIATMADDANCRQYLWELMERCHVFQSSFNLSGSQTFFNEGERNVGLSVFADIMGNRPDIFPLMQQEASKRAAAAATITA